MSTRFFKSQMVEKPLPNHFHLNSCFPEANTDNHLWFHFFCVFCILFFGHLDSLYFHRTIFPPYKHRIRDIEKVHIIFKVIFLYYALNIHGISSNVPLFFSDSSNLCLLSILIYSRERKHIFVSNTGSVKMSTENWIKWRILFSGGGVKSDWHGLREKGGDQVETATVDYSLKKSCHKRSREAGQWMEGWGLREAFILGWVWFRRGPVHL